MEMERGIGFTVGEGARWLGIRTFGRLNAWISKHRNWM
jgi:hypothetical protein